MMSPVRPRFNRWSDSENIGYYASNLSISLYKLNMKSNQRRLMLFNNSPCHNYMLQQVLNNFSSLVFLEHDSLYKLLNAVWCCLCTPPFEIINKRKFCSTVKILRNMCSFW